MTTTRWHILHRKKTFALAFLLLNKISSTTQDQYFKKVIKFTDNYRWDLFSCLSLRRLWMKQYFCLAVLQLLIASLSSPRATQQQIKPLYLSLFIALAFSWPISRLLLAVVGGVEQAALYLFIGVIPASADLSTSEKDGVPNKAPCF